MSPPTLPSDGKDETNPMKNSPASSTSIIQLNVGGKHFTSTLATLTQGPAAGSKLASLFIGSPENRAPLDSEGRTFIDRNPESFSLLLDWLRDGGNDGRTTPIEEPLSHRRLQRELDFFGIARKQKATRFTSRFLGYAYWRQNSSEHYSWNECMLQAAHAINPLARPALESDLADQSVLGLPPVNRSSFYLTLWNSKKPSNKECGCSAKCPDNSRYELLSVGVNEQMNCRSLKEVHNNFRSIAVVLPIH